MKRFALVFCVICTVVLCGNSGDAFAQSSNKEDPISGKGVGISGGIIGGAEVALFTLAAIDVKPVWPWWVVPSLCAGGGGVGGYYLEKHSPGGAVALLVTSMALIIPAALAVSAARAYDPADEGAVDGGQASDAYSFEMVPVEQDMDGESVTEVEERPEGVPDTPVLPEGPPESAASPEEAPPEEAPPAEEAPVDEGAVESPAEPAAGESLPSTSQKRSRREIRIAHLRSGSLLHVDRQLHMGIGLPTFDLRPVMISGPDPRQTLRQGVAFHMPILKVDIP